MARSLSEQPLDFTEDYFPTKLVTDLSLVDDPRIARHMAHPEGLTANPAITFVAAPPETLISLCVHDGPAGGGGGGVVGGGVVGVAGADG